MAIILNGQRQQATINVTPMIDVLLVLLIIFMAVAPEKQSGLETAVPRTPDTPRAHEPENPIVLTIARDGSYALNSQAVEAAALDGRLTEIFGRRAQRVLFVKGDGALEFRTVAAAIDTAHGADIDQIALLPRN